MLRESTIEILPYQGCLISRLLEAALLPVSLLVFAQETQRWPLTPQPMNPLLLYL